MIAKIEVKKLEPGTSAKQLPEFPSMPFLQAPQPNLLNLNAV
jgi:hypothetical protein